MRVLEDFRTVLVPENDSTCAIGTRVLADGRLKVSRTLKLTAGLGR